MHAISSYRGNRPTHKTTNTPSLPYLTLPFGAGVLPPSAEASSGPSAHPRINPKVIETFCRFLQTGEGCSSIPVLSHLFLRNAFQRIHIVSQRWHSRTLPKRCKLVSSSSPQSGHRGSSIQTHPQTEPI